MRWLAFVDPEDLGVHRVAFFDDLGGVGGLAGPGHVRNVDHAIDALLEFHKGSVGRRIAHDSLDRTTHGITKMDLFPRIGLQMAHREGEFLFFLADRDDNGVDFLAFLKNVARPGDATGPGKFGNVHQAFDAGLELDKRSVRYEAGDFSADLEIDRVFFGNLVPGVFGHLFEAEGDSEAFLVDFENEDFDFLTGLEKLGRMTEATPSHIGDVEESVQTVEVDEGSEFGEVFDTAFDLGSLVEVGEELGAFLVAFFLDQFATREDHVLAVFVQLHDPAFEGLAEEFAQIFRGVDVDLGRGQEGFDADVDHETTFHDAFYEALDGLSGFAELDDFIPVLFMGGFLTREDDLAVLVFEAFEKNFDLLPDGEVVRRAEFVQVDGAFRFVADVDHDFAGAAFDNAAFDDGSLAEILHRLR